MVKKEEVPTTPKGLRQLDDGLSVDDCLNDSNPPHAVSEGVLPFNPGVFPERAGPKTLQPQQYL